MNSSRPGGLSGAGERMPTSELLLDTEIVDFLAMSPETWGRAAPPLASGALDPTVLEARLPGAVGLGEDILELGARDLEVLELDQEVALPADPPRFVVVADPCIKVAVAPQRSRARAGRQVAEPPSTGEAANAGLARQLVLARNQAALARAAERRSHEALYHAVGCAYDFALGAIAAPDEFARLIEGPVAEPGKIMGLVVRLVFGFDYDKTRLAEYAAVLALANRLGLARGALAPWLAQAPGGLKGAVAAERDLRRARPGAPRTDRPQLQAALARRLREFPRRELAELGSGEEEFVLILARRQPGGEIAVLGEVPPGNALLAKAANLLVGGCA
ncbi:hypothetical protein H7F51_06845 [Novosphingobium flavum]|uniref:Uncharacterized protein n=1 Tax=Novosphingobium flavum TaxID=1778672 RepID=A0A7X1FQQ5_9SPHN|nr:hypothetical protein [Novosphingobium flavum]MBC2665230.1 hypothetical protein [Novosphingobium flavum]